MRKPFDWAQDRERRLKLWNDTVVGTRGCGGASLLLAPVAPLTHRMTAPALTRVAGGVSHSGAGEPYQAHSLSLTLTTPGRLLPGRSDSVREARVADVEASTNGC